MESEAAVMGKLDITPERWPTLSRLLDEALELQEADRDEWVEGLPTEYESVKPLLRRLLARASRVLSGAALQELPPHPEPNAVLPGPAAGDLIGPWQVLRKLGEGGMASVWMARGSDGAQSPPVALKLPHCSLHDSSLAERLKREGTILASLDHPNIARLLDAGITPAGQPYLAIEYVEGRHIDQFCREERLGIKQRLELYLQTAQALAHAHTRLVIHRDLKPSNILVTGAGQVRLLDFGIAKLLEDGEARQTRLTHRNGQLLTLDYASPEQIAGRALTVASDVYSLGVVLYELLSGVRPYRLKRDSQAALEEAIMEVEPRPPSQAVQDPSAVKALAGDLDTIVLKALKKNIDERYTTVEAFAEDVRRYLGDLPVLAQPDAPWYRLSKFVRRRRILVSLSLGSAVLLLAGSALLGWQARIAFIQEQRAEEVKSFLMSVFLDAHSYWAGRPLSAMDLLHRANSRVDQLQRSERETKIELRNILAASMLSLHDTAGPEDILKKAVEESSGLDQAGPQVLRARMLRNWVRWYRGQFVEMRGEADALLAAMKRSQRTFPEDLASALRARSTLALEEGDAVLATALASESVEVAETRLGLRHNQAVLSLIDLSLAYRAGGKTELALRTGERARARALAAYGGMLTHPNVLKARMAHSQALAASGEMRRAMYEAGLVIEDDAKTFGPLCRAAGLDLRTLAKIQLEAGEVEQARESARRAMAVLGEHYDPESPGWASLLHLRGRILLAAREPAEALPDLKRAEELTSRGFGVTHPRTLAVREDLKTCLQAAAGHSGKSVGNGWRRERDSERIRENGLSGYR